MARWIFRKIAGRIIRIRVGSQKVDSYTRGALRRTVTASLSDTTLVGKLELTIPKKGAHAQVLQSEVSKKFRRHGISREMFKHAQELLGRVGKKFMRSVAVQHPAQVKVRQSSGKSVFIARGLGFYGEKSHKISGKGVAGVVKGLSKRPPSLKGVSHVSATTMIPKKFWKKGV